MWFYSLLASRNSGRSRGPRPQPRPARRGTRLVLEHLEGRTLLSSYSAATVSALIADITAANTAGGANTINLTAPTTSYVLTAANNSTDGPTGLPVIATNDNLTVVGNGDTIERSTAGRTVEFRLFDVAGGASLPLQNLTLRGGSAPGVGVWGEGGAIYNQGALTLNAVTVQGNIAEGLANGVSAPGSAGAGGGIYSNGALTLEGSTKVQNNQALGGPGEFGSLEPGGNGFGGGVYLAGGTATLTDVTLSSNTAQGGMGGEVGASGWFDFPPGGNGGSGLGGGLYIAGGAVTLKSDSLSSNVARGGAAGGSWLGVAGNGSGGALQVSGGTVSVVSSTLSFNTAKGGGQLVRNGTAAEGGGLSIAAGTVTLSNDTVESNTASRGSGGGLYVGGGTVTLANDTVESNTASLGLGGGLYTVSTATVYLDSFTVANTINNTDRSGLNGLTANIDGKYILT